MRLPLQAFLASVTHRWWLLMRDVSLTKQKQEPIRLYLKEFFISHHNFMH
ncbi:hypothetical protein KsCSTR_21670 [Candidatus Kuenenia stuttgartiensis]|uniref:Uncharacterized protein n=1 Tax=Kuenenia stuttgartiensis TaxID=174633 RepID=A0A6G7GPS3_KUEST|nr:hypothetical protein KsCSTR_21670 [Candidatus Kuenenia stuttgartiensis]